MSILGHDTDSFGMSLEYEVALFESAVVTKDIHKDLLTAIVRQFVVTAVSENDSSFIVAGPPVPDLPTSFR